MEDTPASSWEGAERDELAAGWGVPEVHLFSVVGSTNDVARRLAGEGAAAGTVVLADEQRAGRGRMGRAWSSPPGLGISLSLVLRPAELPEPGVLPLLVGLAAARGLDGFVRPAVVQVKWPNDLYLAGRKLGGILCEAAWEGDAPSFVVVGIGINVLHAAEDFPDAVRDTATSSRMATGRFLARDAVAGAVVRELMRMGQAPLALSRAAAAELETRDLLRGQEVAVLDPETQEVAETGVALGASGSGALLLRTRAGALREIRSGTVRLASTLSPGPG